MARSILVCILFIGFSWQSQTGFAGDFQETGKKTEVSDYKGPQDTPKEWGKEIIILRQPYVEKARKTYPQAKARFQSGQLKGYSFFVTIDLYENNLFENVFMAVRKISDGKITAVLATKPVRVKSYQYGKVYVFPESEVIDWTITSPDGNEEGNFIGKFLDEYYTKHR